MAVGRIVAARAAASPAFGLSTLATQLTETRAILDVLDTADHSTQPRSVFSWSYRQLSDRAARLFRLAGLHPGPDISPLALASMASGDGAVTRQSLGELTQMHLLTVLPSNRYTMHDLLRSYAAEQAHLCDSGNERREALQRVFDYYLYVGQAAAALINPYVESVPGPSVIAAHAEVPQSPGDALAWMETEYEVLLAAIRQAVGTGFDGYGCAMAWLLTDFLDRRGRWHEWAQIQSIAVDAASRNGDLAAQARAHRSLGRAHHRLGSLDDAAINHRQVLEAYRTLNDQIGQAHSHINLGRVLENQDRFAHALPHAKQAFKLYHAAAHPAGQATALNSMGWYHAHLGDLHEALARCREALTLHQAIGNAEGQFSTWDSLGYIHARLNEHAEAIACYHQAVQHATKVGDAFGAAEVLEHLGDAQTAAGYPVPAREAWEQALAIMDRLQPADADRVRKKLRAPLENRTDDPVQDVPLGDDTFAQSGQVHEAGSVGRCGRGG